MKSFFIDAISQQEKTSRKLDPPTAEIGSDLQTLTSFSKQFLASLKEMPAFEKPELPIALPQELPGKPTPFSAVLREYCRFGLGNGMNPSSGGFMGYVPGGGIPSAALGDYVAALTNRYSGVYMASPGANEIENTTLRWLRDMVDFPQEAWGSLQSGASLGHLSAIVCARQLRDFEDWSRSPVYYTSECHHSFSKALDIAGLEKAPRRIVPIDTNYQMSVPELKKQIRLDQSVGLKPWLICATAGTTNTGAIDPLNPLADLAQEFGLWLHVDAAYGGFFVLTKSGREKLSGLSRADSLVLDPHKGLFLPYGCGAVLVRNGKLLGSAFSKSSGHYLQDVDTIEDLSPCNFSPELTRHFRSLRLWMSLKIHGLERFRAALEEKLLLAEYLYHELPLISGIEVGPEPQLSCVLFRARGVGKHGEEATKRMLQTVLSRGLVHLSSTRLENKTYIRFCILCFRSHLEHVDQALEEIKQAL